MERHRLLSTPQTLCGSISRDFAPTLTIESGDVVDFELIDSVWHDPSGPHEDGIWSKLPTVRGDGHALVGPVEIASAKPGQTLEAQVHELHPGPYGFCAAGGYPSEWNTPLGIDGPDDRIEVVYELDAENGVARSQRGGSIASRPFLGFMGLAPAEPGPLATRPPRRTGGNIDCRELTVGSSLFLPIEVEGALFFTGDAHAIQGDGEVAGPALECSMCSAKLRFVVHDYALELPRAITPSGYVAFGFDKNLDVATSLALQNATSWIQELGSMSRQEALIACSLAVSLRVTQIVNVVKGVHALFDPEIVRRCL